eukprot:TRINITY_DN9762_c0_g1_i1.p1 TRINITY_DN9762_c0_g1~~TRINITY_DN9762_c0_g1_i1.p1  ORF type:complete len:432 (-),score=62.25 TRINITY_DN9762_c0_g1_i1:14-1309(-)
MMEGTAAPTSATPPPSPTHNTCPLWTTLPTELVVHILTATALRPSDLANFALTCHNAANCVATDTLWHAMLLNRWGRPMTATLQLADTLLPTEQHPSTWHARYGLLAKIDTLFSRDPKACLLALISDGALYNQPYNDDIKPPTDYVWAPNAIATPPISVAEFLAMPAALLNFRKVKWVLRHHGFAQEPFDNTLARSVIAYIDFQGLDLLEALRSMLHRISFPNSNAALNTVCEQLAQQYCLSNGLPPTLYDNATAMVYALVMLNADLHNPRVVEKMTHEHFLRGSNMGCEEPAFDTDHRSAWYKSIARQDLSYSIALCEGPVVVHNTQLGTFNIFSRGSNTRWVAITTANIRINEYTPTSSTSIAQQQASIGKMLVNQYWTWDEKVKRAVYKGIDGFVLATMPGMHFVPVVASDLDLWIQTIDQVLNDLRP